ncbi:TniB family NTP-binding protein [Dyella subtropica]|uniref:TniB family NTP-binding protein n=1 Tax=Dyella subtropica TaxID=2992127 RepID=UPI0022561E86|nr:TniB family NTP-binding protein [Dyella subtropica]
MNTEAHLESDTLSVLFRGLNDRVQWIQSDHWVNTPATRAAIQWMEYLLRSARRSRPSCLQVVAEPGMGKTALLEAFGKLHPVAPTTDPLRLSRPLLLANVTLGDAGVAGLRHALMRAAWPEARAIENHCTKDECDATLKCQGVKMLLLDEAGELLKCGPSAHLRVLSELKRLSSEHQINIACATVEGLDHALHADIQLRSRFKKTLAIRPWTESQDFRNFVFGLEQYLPFPERSYLDRPEVIHWLLRHGKGNTENVVELIRLAALFALGRDAPFVGMADFELARTAELPPPIALGAAA